MHKVTAIKVLKLIQQKIDENYDFETQVNPWKLEWDFSTNRIMVYHKIATDWVTFYPTLQRCDTALAILDKLIKKDLAINS